MQRDQIGVVLWTAATPTHEITAMAYSDGDGVLVTGAQSGHVCMWSYVNGKVGMS